MDNRLTLFLFFALSFSVLEWLFPRRGNAPRRRERWPGHFFMILVGNLLGIFLLPWGTLEWSQVVFEREIGVFAWLGLSVNEWTVALTVLLFDLVIYAQHRFFHWWTPLWKLHRVHHSDTHLDASSALRFHPLEIYLSYWLKLLVIALLGAPPQGVFLFEVILSGCALFNHANLRLPALWDRVLKVFLVTPDFHRVHHSVLKEECHTNFGFNLPWWDYLFKTYSKRDFDYHDKVILGSHEIKELDRDKAMNLLRQPFRGSP